MKGGQRIRRPEIEAVASASRHYELGAGQYFCETARAWEIWGGMHGECALSLTYLIKRLPKSRILWIVPRERRAA